MFLIEFRSGLFNETRKQSFLPTFSMPVLGSKTVCDVCVIVGRVEADASNAINDRLPIILI